MQQHPHAVRSLSTVKKFTTKIKIILGAKTGTVALEIFTKYSSWCEKQMFLKRYQVKESNIKNTLNNSRKATKYKKFFLRHPLSSFLGNKLFLCPGFGLGFGSHDSTTPLLSVFVIFVIEVSLRGMSNTLH